MSERLSRYVQPALSEARVFRQWGEIDPRSMPSSWRSRRMAALAIVVCGVAVAALVLRPRTKEAPSSLEGTVIESGTITLVDGVRVAVAEGGRVRVETVHDDAVSLSLEVGSVDLTVPHSRRTLIVHTPRYDIVDLGTHFRVALDGAEGARVDVAEGSVEVRNRAGTQEPRRLDAGESWSAQGLAQPAPNPPLPPPSADPVANAPPAPASSAPSVRDASAGPKDLLEAAERARLAGHARAEASALDALRQRFRSDPRAALAAFELGRVRLDSLGDATGAVEAFDDALVLAPRGPLREDVEARRVEALASLRSADCATAREAFLARYPRSAHAPVVARACVKE